MTVPAFTRLLGVRLYGEWLILSAIPGYIAVSDMGLLGAASNHVTAMIASGRSLEARDMYRTVAAAITLITVVVAMIALVVTKFVDPSRLLALEIIGASEARTAFLLLIGWTMLIVHNAVPELAWRAAGRFAMGTTLSALFRIADFTAGLGAALLTREVRFVAAAMFVTRLATVTTNHVLAAVQVPDLRLGRAGVGLSQLRLIATPSLSYMLFPIGNAMTLQGMVLVVGASSGPVSVVILSATRTIANVLRQLLQMPANATWPELTRSLAVGDRVTATRLVITLRDLAVWSVVLTPPLSVLAPWAIEMWVGGGARPSHGFVAALSLAVWIEGIWATLGLAPLSVNQHHRIASSYALASLFGLLVAAACVGPIGLYAVPIGLATTNITVLVFAVWSCQTVTLATKRQLLIPTRPASLCRALAQAWIGRRNGLASRGSNSADRPT